MLTNKPKNIFKKLHSEHNEQQAREWTLKMTELPVIFQGKSINSDMTCKF